MHFLDRFLGDDRERLLAAGRVVRLRKGDVLIPRGSRDGTFFLVEQGALEVVESGGGPDLVLDVVGEGAVVGEMAFLDLAPRMADIRAAQDTVCRAWDRDRLRQVLADDIALAAAFYQALAELLIERVRRFAATAVAGGIRGETVTAGTSAGWAVDMAATARRRWYTADARLRVDPGDRAAAAEVRAVLDWLAGVLAERFTDVQDPESEAAAGAIVCRELEPFIVRSRLGRVLWARRDPGRLGDPNLLAHVLLGEPAGDDPFGRALDAALLALPTIAGLRARHAAATARACRCQSAWAAALGTAESDDGQRQALQVMVSQVGSGALVAGLVAAAGRSAIRITCVDGDREALAFLDAGLSLRPPQVELRLVQEDLGTLVLDLSDFDPGTLQVVVIDALADHLPDRLLLGLLRWCRRHLAPGGWLVMTALAPSADASLVDHVLCWPTIRRRAQALVSLAAGAGFEAETEMVEGVGMVVVGATATGPVPVDRLASAGHLA